VLGCLLVRRRPYPDLKSVMVAGIATYLESNSRHKVAWLPEWLASGGSGMAPC
jgi:hypothetical protein